MASNRLEGANGLSLYSLFMQKQKETIAEHLPKAVIILPEKFDPKKDFVPNKLYVCSLLGNDISKQRFTNGGKILRNYYRGEDQVANTILCENVLTDKLHFQLFNAVTASTLQLSSNGGKYKNMYLIFGATEEVITITQTISAWNANYKAYTLVYGDENQTLSVSLKAYEAAKLAGLVKANETFLSNCFLRQLSSLVKPILLACHQVISAKRLAYEAALTDEVATLSCCGLGR
jgi:hypothetical protein